MADKTLACELQATGARIFDSSSVALHCTVPADPFSYWAYVPAITGALSFIVAFGAAVFAWRNVQNTIKANRVTSKKKATIDLIILEQTNQYILEQRQNFLALRDVGNIVQWAVPEAENITSEEKKERDKKRASISTVINKYEMIAIGIENESICEDIYKGWLKSTLIKDWYEVSSFVGEIRRRSGIRTLYEKFEKLAMKWESEQ